MKLTFDRNIFTQIGLDSGSITMLGSVIHCFNEPGEYRGSVHKADGEQSVFYLSVDKNSSVAQVNIDLASMGEYSYLESKQTDCCDDGKECCDDSKKNHFTVNPKGYVLFYVSGGSGGFSVHVRKAVEDDKEKGFNSKMLENGDIFAASIIRPGTYSVINGMTREKAELVVSYPKIEKTAYRPPAPVRIQVGAKGFEPGRIELQPGQGVMFDVTKVSARIVIELLKADDGPGDVRKKPRRGWSKKILLEKKA